MSADARRRVRVATVDEVPPGQGRAFEVAGRTLALFNVAGTWYAIDNGCLHRGGPLAEGTLQGTVVTCPWHAWRWDVTTGANVNNPALAAACFPVRVEGGSVFVEVA